MTYAIRNRQQHGNRARLLLTCGSAALALALTLTPQRAAAQGINAAGTVTDGAALIDNTAPGQTTIDVATVTAVIDWQPFETSGGSVLTFLPAGNTVTFRSGQLPDFAVLNRILPSSNNEIAVINGNVISRITGPTGLAQAGGFVAFYSPTGILIGSTATFDVGSLLLTTLDTSPASFANFVGGGTLNLAASTGSTARIQINPGAQITALAENSFFAVVAADVEMLGTARINGSHAYVAGEVVNLSLSNGLFNITIPVGTAAAGEVVTLNGDVGGPSSTGVGDNHILYAVARASTDPISMLFRGNLGFDPAQSAGIVNGEIILAANYDVFGRNVDTGSVSDGIDAVFRDVTATSDVRADITLDTFNARSSVLAIGTGEIIARGESRVRGNLSLVGRIGALIDSNSVDNFSIDGDVLVDARDYGVVSSSLQSLDAINATGGSARIISRAGSRLSIGGNVLVAADAFGGADDLSGIAGSALGGLAEISAAGGSITVNGSASVRASGFGTNLDNVRTGAEARGGTARFIVSGGGSAVVNLDLLITANGIGAQGGIFNPSTVSDAYGGNARLAINGTGTINVGGGVELSANAFANSVNAVSGGALADAGEASVGLDGDNDLIIAGGLTLRAEALGGQNNGGQGGLARGGAARAVTNNGGRITVAGAFLATAQAAGGDGLSGGEAFGGIAGANAITGAINLQQLAIADASAFGGNAIFGFGGNGGLARGGNAFFQANGNLTQIATLSIGGDASVSASGTGGLGGMGSLAEGQAIAAGRGGDGYGGAFNLPNQADPNFGGGAYLLAGGDNGNLSVGGVGIVAADGEGGRGGSSPSTVNGGIGGDGFGGLAQAGLALLGLDGSVGLGSASFGTLIANASGAGGSGGSSGGDFPTGAGGNGTGGNALLTVRAGEVTAGQVQLGAFGGGGDGALAGNGTGGIAGVLGSLGGALTVDGINASAIGFGGFGTAGRGGTGTGGQALIALEGIDVIANADVNVDASGFGGSSIGGSGGDGTGGTAYIGVTANSLGSGTFNGNTTIAANGFGGAPDNGGTGGTGSGGLAYAQAQGGSTVRFGSLQVTASGRGGESEDSSLMIVGGDGRGGIAELRSLGSGSRLIIERNASQGFLTPDNDGAILAALGLGGRTTGGSGLGGSGSGGSITVRAALGGSIALPADPLNDPESVGAIRLIASGIGGGSSVEGGIGGSGTGGNALIEADSGTITMGETTFRVFGSGGSSLLSTGNITGGSAFGGRRSIRVLNGGEATLALVGNDLSGAQGGDGTGTGNGGRASSGMTFVELNGGTLNINGVLDLRALARGGDGARGGDAFNDGENGGTSFVATNSVITLTPDESGRTGIVLGAIANGGDGTTAGGNAFGELVAFALTNTDLSGGFLTIAPRTEGGNVIGGVGQGGNATSSAVRADIIGSTLNLVGENLVTAIALGGDGGIGAGSIGGSAASASAVLALDDSSITIAPFNATRAALTVQSLAVSGNGSLGGNATAGLARLQMLNASLESDQLLIESSASTISNSSGGISGAARAGVAEADIAGTSQVDVVAFNVASNAGSSIGGSAEGGVASLTIAANSQSVINAQDVNLIADGTGSDNPLANVAGRFVLDVNSGNLNVGDVFASARGDVASTDLAPSLLSAQGGNINVSGTLLGFVRGDLAIQTGQGGIIGSPVNASTTTAVAITSQGLIEISGDNNALIGLGGDSISLTSRQLNILAGARIGARAVAITSLNTAFTAVLGGTAEGEGFSLTADEVRRINAQQLTFTMPEVLAPNDPNRPDLIIRDLALAGTLSGGLATVGIRVGNNNAGIVRVEGTVSYANAGVDDLLSITSGERIEIVTPGGIRITDGNNALGGRLSLQSGNIWVADADLLAQLRLDPEFGGRDTMLSVAALGSADPLGYVRARDVDIAIAQRLLVRNTGGEFASGGILVGDGGLSIIGFTQQSGETLRNAGLLDVFAYGGRLQANGVVLTGEAFFREVNFNNSGQDPTTYSLVAAFNDCIITTGVCPPPPPPPSSERPQVIDVNNPTVIVGPFGLVGTPPPFDREDEDDRFGIDFPELPEAPLISVDPLLDDPVSSGGDTSVYGTPAPPLTGGK